MNPVAYNDFAKLDLRVAKILAAERIPETDKLMKLSIDVGEFGERTLVAGIAQHYTPEALVGKHIIIVANLESRKLKGIESQGMLLAVSPDLSRMKLREHVEGAASDKGGIILLIPDRETEPGSKVN